ncbi:hypothetical protein BBO99_00004112 [Phytophthora kernoviae]|uniref:Receptor expression-enhancing protein n=2 Tax=Phytophthora kernoviae TaxID=325452 RepID=A0A421ET88_9STRA|nr:hypothetical protein G195_004733 [Phytophthora kernoviae 00238/432]KAG2526384.1 hypothetical protein JM16_003840 [Phytophthora kernoviae]KAG2527917.1 hypothetical protein JM18_003471 [Phytophthora kernoviae]RLM96910.1 hypothetical protein BBI17_004260 [Phytophthora kernoviae]RLN80994.1 hypothetical protein BBO99_00004112 [Phytophthora kernoviae]
MAQRGIQRVLALATASSKRSLGPQIRNHKAMTASFQTRLYSSGPADPDFVALHPSGKPPKITNSAAEIDLDDLDDEDDEDMLAEQVAKPSKAKGKHQLLFTMEKVQVYMDKWAKDLEKFPVLQSAQDATGVEKLYLVAGASAVLLLLLLVGFGAGLICNLVGFVYPAFCSFKAIETDDKKDDVQWLTYWVVYACFNLVEVFADFLLYWIPFYYAFKLGFLLWLFMPSTLGASFLYMHFLAPFLKSQESRIDRAMKEAMTNGGAVISDISGVARDIGKDVSKAVASKIVDNASK